jgi:predicted nucleotidyltransferase component of viral defense system
MIDENTLMSFSHFFADTRQLEKDYLVNLMLKAISVNRVSNNMEFKGGTALYMFHGLDRFSEDLDFTYIGNDTVTGERLDFYIEPVIKDFGLSYNVSKNKGNVVVRDDGGAILGARTELFIEGPLFEKTGVRHKIKIDISARNDTIMKPEAARLVSKYGDIGTILIYKMPIGEALAEKFCAIMERLKARDLYDAYFLLKYKEVPYNESMIVEKLNKRSETFDKKVLLTSLDMINANIWNEELAYLIKNLPELGEVKEFVKSKIA